VIAAYGAKLALPEAIVRRFSPADQCPPKNTRNFPIVRTARASKVVLEDQASEVTVPIRLGTSILSLMQSDNHVAVRFTDGTLGEYDLVVGADGIASTVRELALGATPLQSAGHVGWRSLVPIRPRGLEHLQSIDRDRRFVCGESLDNQNGPCLSPHVQRVIITVQRY
jgi:2-polyprenyl-6-methoxyphenol hydroxylase-like FAD-dependent oxidoreductase